MVSITVEVSDCGTLRRASQNDFETFSKSTALLLKLKKKGE
jgi:hypothetical protein